MRTHMELMKTDGENLVSDTQKLLATSARMVTGNGVNKLGGQTCLAALKASARMVPNSAALLAAGCDERELHRTRASSSSGSCAGSGGTIKRGIRRERTLRS